MPNPHDPIRSLRQSHVEFIARAKAARLHVDLTLRCPTCGKRADMCFDHGDDWKKRTEAL